MARARFLHTADLHLSRPFGFLPPQLAEERRRDQRRVLTRIADMALDREVDLILISGDLFDCPDPDPTDLEAVVRELTRLGESGKRIFAVPGNHDYVSDGSFWRRIGIPGLHVFLTPEWGSVSLEDLGIAVRGAAFHRRNSERRAFESLRLSDEMPSVVLAHASHESFEGQVERHHPFSSGEISALQASYVALGHYHKLNHIPAGGTAACYPGTPEGISFDRQETEERHVIIGEIGDDGAASFEPVKVNGRTMRSVQVDCTSFDSQASLFDTVRKFCGPDVLLEIKLSGMPNAEVAAVLEEMPQRFRESCIHLSVDVSNLLSPVDQPVHDLTIRGRFCKYLIRRIEDAPDTEQARLLRRALELGLAAFAEE